MDDLMLGDCLERMKDIPDNYVDLIIIDPPYNIGKSDKWDKWKNQHDYIEWLGSVFIECQRVLNKKGSFYFFHNDFVQMSLLQSFITNNTRFIFKQLIVWNKRFLSAKSKGFLDGFVEVEELRNYQKMAEYCLFYTFQSDYLGYSNTEEYKEIREYFKSQRDKVSGMSFIDINKKLDFKTNGGSFASDVLNPYKKSWKFPSKHIYIKFNELGICDKPYEDLRCEYEKERERLKSGRYVFNNQKTHHSVWEYDIARKEGHITPKPCSLIENIILHSSYAGGQILDCFMGSGTTGVACKNLNRNFIGIEIDEAYFNIAKKRIDDSEPPNN